MSYTDAITLDLNPQGPLVMIEVKQLDADSRTFTFNFTKDGIQYDISGWTNAAVRIRKPDGTFIFNDFELSQQSPCYSATITFDEQCFIAPGRAYADIVSFEYRDEEGNYKGEILSTRPFIINIVPSPVGNGTEVTSSSEFLYLKAFIDQGNALTNKMSFVTFDLDYTDGNLYLITAISGELEDDLNFSVTNDGYLEVTFND